MPTKNIVRLSKRQRWSVRHTISQIRQRGGPQGTAHGDRAELRLKVVQAMRSGEKSDAIVALLAPRLISPSKMGQVFCAVCNRLTRHRNGECQDHTVKYCSTCEAATPHTVNGKCTRHQIKFCPDCGFDRTFVDGRCARSYMHQPHTRWFL